MSRERHLVASLLAPWSELNLSQVRLANNVKIKTLFLNIKKKKLRNVKFVGSLLVSLLWEKSKYVIGPLKMNLLHVLVN